MIVAHSSSSSSLKVFFVVLCSANFFFLVSSNFTADLSVESFHPEAGPLRHSVPATHISTYNDLRMPVYQFEGRYIAKVILGRNYPVDALLYTGNNFNQFLCKPCDPCFQYTDTSHIFNPNSNSYKKVNFNNRYCRSVRGKNSNDGNSTCIFEIQSVGLYISGTLSTDTLRFNHEYAVKALDNFTFGCIHKAIGHMDEPATGIIALGMHFHSLPMQLRVKFFFICLPHPERRKNNGWVEFSDELKQPGNDFITTPLFLLDSTDFSYYVNIRSFTVEHDTIPINQAHVHFSVDTRESMSFVDAETMSRLVDSITRLDKFPLVSIPRYNLCFNTSRSPTKPRLPGMTVTFFGGGSIHLDYTNIFLQHDRNTWCLTFVAGAISILGGRSYAGRKVVVNLKDKTMSFNKKQVCPA